MVVKTHIFVTCQQELNSNKSCEVRMKRYAIAGLVTAFVCLLLWGSWVFDPSSARGHESQKVDEVFSYPLPAETAVANGDILISCNEETLGTPISEFSKWKGLSGVPLAIPGGPLAIARLNDVAISDQIKPAQRAAIEVLKRYSPRKVVLVTHETCLYYDTIAAWNNSSPTTHQHQADDLEVAMQVMREWFPKAEVSGYNARIENNKLVFHPVSESGR